MHKSTALGLALGTILTAAGAVDYEEQGRRWWSHIVYLADDKLEGRDTGSRGHLLAARYVAAEFEKAGLQPAGTSGYLQPVPFLVTRIDEPNSSFEWIHDGKVEPLKLGEDLYFGLRSGAAPRVEAGAVFAGYGISVPEKKFDEFAGLDLKGKIVVYLTGAPKNFPSELASHYQSADERWKRMRELGAIGSISITNPAGMDVPWARSAQMRFMPTMRIVNPAEGEGAQLSARLNADAADRLFGGSGHTMAEILAAAKADGPLPKFTLNGTVRAKISVKQSSLESQNVAAILPGSDPKLKNEYIVMSAHLDHLGMADPGTPGDRIFNGALDNASGVATVLEVARMLHESKTKLKRSVLFVTVTGEEKGLQGSRYFSMHPTVSATNIVADLNMDMFLPLYPLKSLVVYGLTESTLGDDMHAIAAQAGVDLTKDREPERNIFTRSDQYSFIREGVPALSFKFGNVAGSPEEMLAKDWVHTRYHSPSDDLNQPVDKAAAARFNELIRELTVRIANGANRPAWKENSFFKRFQKWP